MVSSLTPRHLQEGMGGPTANNQCYATWGGKLNPPMVHGVSPLCTSEAFSPLGLALHRRLSPSLST